MPWQHMYMSDRHEYSETLRNRERQSNTTQYNTTQDLRQLFPKKKLYSGGNQTHASHILGMMLYHLSYWGSSAGSSLKSPIQSEAKQSKAKWASQLDTSNIEEKAGIKKRPCICITLILSSWLSGNCSDTSISASFWCVFFTWTEGSAEVMHYDIHVHVQCIQVY